MLGIENASLNFSGEMIHNKYLKIKDKALFISLKE